MNKNYWKLQACYLLNRSRSATLGDNLDLFKCFVKFVDFDMNGDVSPTTNKLLYTKISVSAFVASIRFGYKVLFSTTVKMQLYILTRMQ